MIGAVVLAGGQGKRMGAGKNKQYITIAGRSVLSYAIESMAAKAAELIIVVAKGEENEAWTAVHESGIAPERVRLAEGGRERQDSVRNALGVMPERWQKVLIHDGARPFVPPDMLTRILEATEPGLGVVPGISVTDTIKRVDDAGFVAETPPRAFLRAVQTPQCFMAAEIRALHIACAGSGRIFTDDAMLYEESGKRVRLVEGSVMARKLTVPDDLLWAEKMKEAWEETK